MESSDGLPVGDSTIMECRDKPGSHQPLQPHRKHRAVGKPEPARPPPLPDTLTRGSQANFRAAVYRIGGSGSHFVMVTTGSDRTSRFSGSSPSRRNGDSIARTSRKTGKSPALTSAAGSPAAGGGPGLAGGSGEAGISAQRTATMAHGCCPAGAGNRIYGPSLLRERHPWAIVAVTRPGATASMSHRCCSGRDWRRVASLPRAGTRTAQARTRTTVTINEL